MSDFERLLLVVFQAFLYALIILVISVVWYFVTHLFTFFIFWNKLKGYKLLIWLLIGFLWPILSIIIFAVLKI
jgi:hypothetical protein